MALNSLLAMQNIEHLSYREFLEMKSFFANSYNTRKSLNEIMVFEKRLLSYIALFRQRRYDIDLSIVESEPEVSIQESTPKMIIDRSWKEWAFYKALFRSCHDAVKLKFTRNSTPLILPKVDVESSWSEYPYLLREVVNLVFYIDASANPWLGRNGTPAAREQVYALLHAIDVQLNGMPGVERVRVQLTCGPVKPDLLWLELKRKLEKRMERRHLWVDVRRVNWK